MYPVLKHAPCPDDAPPTSALGSQPRIGDLLAGAKSVQGLGSGVRAIRRSRVSEASVRTQARGSRTFVVRMARASRPHASARPKIGRNPTVSAMSPARSGAVAIAGARKVLPTPR